MPTELLGQQQVSFLSIEFTDCKFVRILLVS